MYKKLAYYKKIYWTRCNKQIVSNKKEDYSKSNYSKYFVATKLGLYNNNF